jgi:hypothetical protein
VHQQNFLSEQQILMLHSIASWQLLSSRPFN